MTILINLLASVLNFMLYFYGGNSQIALFFSGFSFGVACLFAMLMWDDR